MSQFKAFFMENAAPAEEHTLVVSDRFKGEDGKPIPWVLKSISESENKMVRNASTKKVKSRSGQMSTETDHALYMSKLVVSCVVFPDLKDAKLQDSYGVRSPESLIEKMLMPGEFADLVTKIQDINGFDRDPNEVIEEVKNS